jgi:hypothetical protein
MLSPFPSYHLDRAVAATYSLDLNTLLSIPVALFYSQTLEGKLGGERFQLLEAIQRTAKIVTVYYQEGQIPVPDRYNRLFAYVEKMIVPVRPTDAFSSFHPKVWVLRYCGDQAKEQPVVYRVLVLTRNLTNDHCWDLAVSLEGRVGSTTRKNNEPLIDFLKHLHRLHPIDDFRRFARDLAKAKFEKPDCFDRVAFHPMGIEGHRNSPLIAIDADGALCMSPFLDNGTLRELRRLTKGDFWLFGRKAELEKLSRNLLAQPGFKAYCIADLVVEGERMIDDSQEDRQEQDLHAKLFIFDQGDKCRWFVGSANATKAARLRNTEFLVELISTDRHLAFASLIKELLGDHGSPQVFEEFHSDWAGKPDPATKQRAVIRRLEHDLAQMTLRGSLSSAANQTNYDLTITLDLRRLRAPAGFSLEVKPLNCTELVRVKFGTMNTLTFANIKETEISRFIVFALSLKGEIVRRFVIGYDVKGMPGSRLDSIFRSIVSNRDTFLEYIRFLLAGEVSKDDLLRDPSKKPTPSPRADEFSFHPELPIFEQLIIAASRDLSKLKRVDNVIERLKAEATGDEGPVPPEFLDFWDVFRRYLRSIEGGEGVDAN